MPLSDLEIIKRVEDPEIEIIEHFIDSQKEEGVISFGLSSHGYDMRLDRGFVVFHKMPGENYYRPRLANKDHVHRFPLLDPKNTHPETCEYITVGDGYCLVLQPGDYALGSSVEKFNMPDDVMAIILGKSTYARSGLVVNFTPLEAGWAGHVTVELSNPTQIPIVVYVMEGIAQVLFFQVDGEVRTTYADKDGKYQNQEDRPILSKIK